ncbi:MAG: class I SAM-dependent methyltransferase [Gemmatimonadota bacterium]
MSEELRPGDEAGAETLEIMSAAPRYNAWQYEVIAAHIGRRVLEVGSGIGNMSEQILTEPRDRVILTDIDPWYRGLLAQKFIDRPEVQVAELCLPDPIAPEVFRGAQLDTVVALNVVEHIQDDVGALTTIRQLLVRGGHAVILVPAMDQLYGSLDQELGHFRRYTRRRLATAFEKAGLHLVTMKWFNRVGTLGWWINARVRLRRRIPLQQLKAFDTLVPLLRLERFLPFPFGQSLIAVGTPA